MSDVLQKSLSRRNFLSYGAASLVAATVLPQRAGASLNVPTVDRLVLTTVIDNATFGPFLDDLSLPGMHVMRAGNGLKPGLTRMSPHTLMAEFGLSLLAESSRGAQRRKVLVDFGYSAEVMRNNLALLNIDPASIDAAVLSHGHLDHYGGFPGVFGDAAPVAHRRVLTVGGEETFCERVAQIGIPPPIMGALDRDALKRAGFDVQIKPEPAVIADHAFTSGIIPLKTTERTAIPTQMRPGVGCDRALLSAAKRDSVQIVDDGEHELATCYLVKGLGLVVIASCSHRGVINSVRRAQAVSGVDKVHAVLGGFHLVKPRTEDEARQTVAEFVKIDPTYIVPMHCSGEVFTSEALRLMPQKLVRSYVGSRFEFSVS